MRRADLAEARRILGVTLDALFIVENQRKYECTHQPFTLEKLLDEVDVHASNAFSPIFGVEWSCTARSKMGGVNPLIASSSPTNNRLHGLWRAFSQYLIPFGLLVFAVPFIALLFYASMNGDDYIYATNSYNCSMQPAVRNMFTSTWLNYTQGSGRWLTSIFHGLLMTKFNLISFYPFPLIAIMLSNFLALAYWFAKFLRVSRNQALLAAGIFYAAWLASVVTPIEGVYWLTEAIEYQLSFTAILILAGLLCTSRQTRLGYVALALLAIAVPAQHEIAGAFLLVCLGAGLIAAYVKKVETRQWWLCFGLVALSLGAVIFSPGKILQFAQGHKETPDVAHVLPFVKHAIKLGFSWLMTPAVLVSALILPIVLRFQAQPPSENHYRPPRWLALVGLGIMCIVVAEYGAAEMTSGYGVLPYRTVGWFQFVFWLLLVCTVLVGLPDLSQMKFSDGSRIGISMLLVVTLLGSPNFRTAEKDWRGPAKAYWRSSVARLEQRGSSLQFDALPPRPALFRDTGLSTTPKCWVNSCMAVYLGVNSVVTKDPTENPGSCVP
jgi:hypothetical protein